MHLMCGGSISAKKSMYWLVKSTSIECKDCLLADSHEAFAVQMYLIDVLEPAY